MLTDLQIAIICNSLYSEQPSGYWDAVFPTDGSYSALKWVSGYLVLVRRGSVTPTDWLERDLTSIIPVWDDELGHCGSGFLTDMRQTVTMLDKIIGDAPLIVTGHSLGAAVASLYVAHRVKIGKPPVASVVFGEPRPGFERIKDIHKTVPGSAYRNVQDPVTQVPFLGIPETTLDLYTNSRNLKQLGALPDPGDLWGSVADHHMPLYVKGLGG